MNENLNDIASNDSFIHSTCSYKNPHKMAEIEEFANILDIRVDKLKKLLKPKRINAKFHTIDPLADQLQELYILRITQMPNKLS